MNVKRACDSGPEGADESFVSVGSLESAVAVPDETDSLPRPMSGTALAFDGVHTAGSNGISGL